MKTKYKNAAKIPPKSINDLKTRYKSRKNLLFYCLKNTYSANPRRSYFPWVQQELYLRPDT